MQLDEAECIRLISAGGVGRLAYAARSGVAILLVSFQLHEGSIVFPTSPGSPAVEAESSAGATPEHFLRITPTLIAGRRLSRN